MRFLPPSLALCLLASGCLLGPAIDELDNAADCNTICNEHRSCGDGSEPLVACVERCEDRSDDSDEFMERVDACESCLGDNDCDIAGKCERSCALVMP